MNARTRSSLALLAAALLGACANIPTPTEPPTLAPTAAPALSTTLRPTVPTSTPLWLPTTDAPFFLEPGRRVSVDRDYLDRYLCSTGEPLMCQCFSRLSQNCDCNCD